jgi:hypothetical protein
MRLAGQRTNELPFPTGPGSQVSSRPRGGPATVSRSAGDQAVLNCRGGAGGTHQQCQRKHDEHHHAEEHHCPAHHRPLIWAGRQPRTSRWRGGRDGVATLASRWPRQRFARPETEERRHLRVAPLVKRLGGDLRSHPAARAVPSALEGLTLQPHFAVLSLAAGASSASLVGRCRQAGQSSTPVGLQASRHGSTASSRRISGTLNATSSAESAARSARPAHPVRRLSPTWAG